MCRLLHRGAPIFCLALASAALHLWPAFEDWAVVPWGIPAFVFLALTLALLVVWGARRLRDPAGIGWIAWPASLAGTLLGMGLWFTSAAGRPQSIRWHADLDAVLARDGAARRPLLVAFRADWCEACTQLDRTTFSDARVRRQAQNYICVRFDATDENDLTAAVLGRYGVDTLPTVVFIRSDGQPMSEPRIEGFVGPRTFVAALRQGRAMVREVH